MSKISQNIVEAIFEESLVKFLEREAMEIVEGVNERNNCGRWAFYLQEAAHQNGLTNYIADPEYNRKQDGKIKTILDKRSKVVTIICDLVLHTRGIDISQDNLIAIEVKKYDRPEIEKIKDRQRLRALTKESYDEVWMNEGASSPEHVCGYRLGVFVELYRYKRICKIDIFQDGEFRKSYERGF